MSKEQHGILGKAERDIAAILAALELATGSRVDRIAISSIDVTRMESPTVEFLRAVKIDLQSVGRWHT